MRLQPPTMFYEKRYDRYICATHSTGQGCTNNAILNSVIMAAVAAKIRTLILMGSQKALAEHIAKIRGKKPIAIPDHAQQLAELNRKIASAADRLLEVDAGLVPAVQEAMRKLQARRDALAVTALPVKKESSTRTPAASAARIWQLDELLRTGDLASVQAALAQVIQRIELTFEQSKRDRRRWFPIGGTVFFLVTTYLTHHGAL